MALDQRLFEITSAEQHGSVGSRRSASDQNARLRFLKGPWAKVIAKAAGISLTMLGLGGIGALATAKGVTVRAPASITGTGHSTQAPATAWIASGSLLTGAAARPPAAPASARVRVEPVLSEQIEPRQHESNGEASESQGSEAPGLTKDGRVILNTAAIDQLRKLPGVGQKRAEAIVALRTKLGRFRRPTELLRVRGIGPKRLKQMLPRLVLDVPPEDKPLAPSPAPKGS